MKTQTILMISMTNRRIHALAVALALFSSTIAGASEPSLVPENARAFLMTLQDGQKWRLYRTYEDPEMLISAGPWTGMAEGWRATVVADSGSERPTEGYEFFRGRLVRAFKDGKESTFTPAPEKGVTDIGELWRKAASGMLDRVDSIDHWRTSGRLRIKMGNFINPNKTAAIFVELALCALAAALVAWRRRRVFFAAVSAVGCVAAAAALSMTRSRGGLLAFVVGAAILFLPVFLGRISVRGIVAGVIAAVLIAISLFAFSGGRFGKGFLSSQGQRADRRMLWKAAMSMMIEAPSGWGSGRSGAAYVDWHQPDEQPTALTELQNSHLTWMVEHGWSWRMGYVFLWTLLAALLLVAAAKDSKPLPAALWMSLWTAACFTHELEEPLLWLLPVVSLALLADSDFTASIRRRMPASCAIAAIVAVATCGTVYALGSCWTEDGKPKVRAISGGAIVNGSDASRWVVRDDVVLDGGYQIYVGKEVRAFYEDFPGAPPCGLVGSIGDLPREMDSLLLSGRSGRRYLELFGADRASTPKAHRITFLSPPFSWQEIPQELLGETEVRLVSGEMAIGSEELGRPKWVIAAPGAELYVPGWMEYAVLK